jgi:MFS family permease
MAAPPNRHRFRLLFFCMVLVGAGNSMLLSVAPPLVRRLQLPDSSIGWIFSLSALLWVLCSPFWGRYSDRVGRRPVAALGLAAFGLSMALFGGVVVLGLNGALAGAGLLTAMMMARAVFGAFGSASNPAAQAYIADHTTPFERTQELAGLSASFAVGAAFGPAICAALASKLGLVFPIILIAVLAGINALVIWRFLPEQDQPAAQRGTGGDWRQSLALMRDGRLSAYLLYGLGLSVVSTITAQILGLFVIDRLHAPGEQGAELTAAGFMVSALAMLATQLAILPRLRLGARELMVWGAGLTSVGIAIQIIAPSLSAILVAQAALGMGFGLARSGMVGGASVAVRPHEQGAAAGLMVSINGAGFVFSPFLGALTYEHFGMTAPLYIALALLAAMLAFALISRRLREPASEAQ